MYTDKITIWLYTHSWLIGLSKVYIPQVSSKIVPRKVCALVKTKCGTCVKCPCVYPWILICILLCPCVCPFYMSKKGMRAFPVSGKEVWHFSLPVYIMICTNFLRYLGGPSISQNIAVIFIFGSISWISWILWKIYRFQNILELSTRNLCEGESGQLLPSLVQVQLQLQ